MSDGRDKTPDGTDENTDSTLIRGSSPATGEANDDATLMRQKAAEASAEPNDDETRLKKPQTVVNDNAAIVRGRSSEDGTADETQVRAEQPRDTGDDSSANETLVRSAARQDHDGEATILKQPGGSEQATILRSPKGESEEATIVRSPGAASGQATILRSGEDRAGGGAAPEPPASPLSDDDATIIGVGAAGDDDEDRTIMAPVGGDDDRTIMNDDYADDATVLGAGSGKQDTTYIASVGRQMRPQGNSEAGRLLKNRFVLEEKIGSGGMGDVYKALDLRQQEAQERDPYVAIKLLNENFSRHKDAYLSLQRETSRTRGIPHPNIMAVYDFDREGDTVFMSMELLDGKPLDDYLKEHPEGVSQEDAWRIIDGICKGLMRAHDAGIVHSDFKPGNIFFTKDKNAKVFDFGIARAVSNPNELEAEGEKTVFDAGSLGALTPTYASYEMLKGLEPSKSDDVYAVALVAYELFMGKHPYDRVPADKALERGLTPKPVPFLKRRHWKALKRALSLKGEERTQSIDEFYEGMFSLDPPYLRYAGIASVILASVGFAAYSAMNVKEKPDDLIAYEDGKAAALATLAAAKNTQDWNSDVWHDRVSQSVAQWRYANNEIAANEDWVEDFQLDVTEDNLKVEIQNVAKVYLDKIEDLREEAIQYSEARHEQFGVEQARDKLLEAQRYLERVASTFRNGDPDRFAKESQSVAVRLQLRQEGLARIEADEEAFRIAEEERLAREKAEQERIAFETAREGTYTAYLDELKVILKCKGKIPLDKQERLGFLLSSMKTEWNEAYNYHYPKIVEYLGTCIEQRIGYVFPAEARDFQAKVVGFLPGESRIASIVIEDKDPCADRGLIGRGNMNRNWCRDPLSEGGDGPELVVIPQRSEAQPKYAISRAEIKVLEFNQYCEFSGKCQQIAEGRAGSLPVTNVTLNQARDYAQWLSAQTGESYRLPTVDEWSYAAKTGREDPDVLENVNCTVDSRGVRLGETLVNAVSGRANAFGLFNFVGNAREWALADGETLLALGGAHTDPRAQCSVSMQVPHEGAADPVTGFRLVREIPEVDANKSGGEVAASGGD